MTTEQPGGAAIYCRVSSERQGAEDRTSLQTQEAACRDYALRNGLIVEDAHVYIECYSGNDVHGRPALQELLAAAQKRVFSVVLVYSVDRFSRNPADFHVLLNWLDPYAVRVHFVSRDYSDSPEGQLWQSMETIFAHYENQQRVERSMRGKRARVAKGHLLPGNRPLYGYRYADERKTRLEIDPVTGPVVQRIFSEYASGSSLHSLAVRLSEEGVPTPSVYAKLEHARPYWEPNSIRMMLYHSGYWGEWRAFRMHLTAWSPEERGQHRHAIHAIPTDETEQIQLPSEVAPRLIEPELAALVQQRLAAGRSHSQRNTHPQDETMLHHGLVKCGYCGHALRLKWRLPKDRPNIRIEYACPGGDRMRGRACRGVQISAPKLDEAVWSLLCRYLIDPDLIVEMMRDRQESNGREAQERLAAITKHVEVIEAEQAALYPIIAQLTNERARQNMLARLSQLGEEQEQLERRLCEAQAQLEKRQLDADLAMRSILLLTEFKNTMFTATKTQRRDLLRAIGVQVVVYAEGDCNPRAVLDWPLSAAYPPMHDDSDLVKVNVPCVSSD